LIRKFDKEEMMHIPNAGPRGPHRQSWRLLAASLALAAGLATPAMADEADARRLLKAMSDYVAAQTTIAFDYDSSLDVVTQDGLKIGLASSGTAAIARPDKLRVTRTGGFADVELVFDGKTASLLGKNLNAYAQIDAPGTIDQLMDTLRDDYRLSLPGGDLLTSNPDGTLAASVSSIVDLGSGVIGGVECDHVALRAEDVDVQVWIAQGDAPHPCRLVITSKGVDGQPQYSVDISDWKAGDAVPATDFAFTAPAGATKVEPGKLTDIDELPSHFTPGDAK